MRASLSYLHHQSSDWLRELDFYKEELYILTKRLEETVSNTTDKEVLAQVEHFQNKFILLQEQVDILNHDILIRGKGIERIVLDKPEHIGEKFNTVRDAVFTRMRDMAHSIADVRYEFNRFLSKCM